MFSESDSKSLSILHSNLLNCRNYFKVVYYKCYFNNSSVLTKIKVKAIGLAKNIQSLRKEKGLTQEELAKNSGIAYATLVKLEQGLLVNPTLKTLQKLADVFKITIDELIKA